MEAATVRESVSKAFFSILLDSQGRHGVDSDGAPRRNVAGRKRDQQEEQRNSHERRGIGGRDVK